LLNTIERVVCFAEETVITGRDVATWLPKASLVPPTLSTAPSDALYELQLKEATTQNTNEFQRRYCERLLLRTGGNLKKAIAHSGYSDRGLKELFGRLGLRKDESPAE